ncbi:MAG: cupin domain-containing protein [Methyloceanibacter sp.]|jgi:anti-sigma factor ChrR (cupin superfamily)
MKLNADFSQRAAVHAASLPWTASPMAGVDRRMLDRIGDEVARATSIVRYAPGSSFSSHVHTGGEEFFVLDGVFQDEHGDFPAGCYIRNPPQSRHTPGSAPGCTIFVKLWQFDLDDRTQVRIDTSKMPYVQLRDRANVEMMPLFRDAHEDVRLERWAPGAAIFLPVPGGAEFLLLAGTFEEAGEQFVPQSWLRLPAGATLNAVAGAEGCVVWAKSGHLSQPSASPPS